MRNIVVEDLKQTPLEKQRIEIVERKGLGHPDYICVPPDTLIIGNLSIQQISSFKVGDKVLTHTGEFKSVTKIFHRPYVGNLILIRPYHGQETLATPNHPIFAIKTRFCKVRQRLCRVGGCSHKMERKCKKIFENYGPEWIAIENLKRGDYILLPYPTKVKDLENIKISDHVKNFVLKGSTIYGLGKSKWGTVQRNPKAYALSDRIEVNEDFMRLIGYYIAEGSTSQAAVCFDFNKNERKYIKDVTNLLKSIFKLEPKVQNEKNTTRVYVNSTVLAQFFKNVFGGKSAEKRLPSWVMYLPVRKQYQLIVGMFRGDGCVDQAGTRYITTSRQLAYQTRMILFRLGILNSIQIKKAYLGKILGRDKLTQLAEKYTIVVHEELMEIFNKQPKKAIVKHPTLGFIKDGFVYLPIRYTAEVPFAGTVYNLEVEEDSTYATVGALLHNCDAIMDQISVRLCKEYLEKAGAILHHNVDKSLLVAGVSEPRFGGGTVKHPMLFVFGDRATSEINGEKIDVGEIAVNVAKKWFKENMRFVDPEKHVRYQVELKPGSVDLVDIFKRKGKVLGANDTSAAVGYAPMTRTEKIVLKTEQALNLKEFKQRFPESGEDIKVMGSRSNNDLHLTISMAFVDRYINGEEEYFEKKAKILEETNKFVVANTDFDKVSVELNTLDVRGRGIGGIYLTVLGTSADSGDSGQVGRGNRVNGLISLNRPFCSEAAAGKNPVSHVGKIYNALTFKIAQHVYEEVPEVEEAYIWLLSKIGSPIDHPAIAAAQVIMKGNSSLETVRHEIEEVLDYELENIDKFCMELARGKIPIC